MALYVKLYEGDRRSAYEGFVEGYPSSDTLVVGRAGDAAVLARLDPRGTLSWQKRYRFGEGAISFSHGVGCPNDDAVLYGRLTADGRPHHLVVRVDREGGVVWSRAYRSPSTRFTRRLVRAAGEKYFFTGWHNLEGTRDSVELVKVDGAGNVRAARVFGSDRDDQVATILPFGTGCVIVGETAGGAGWDGFVAAFKADLGLSWARLLGGPRFDTVQAAVQLAGSRFLLAGLTTPGGGGTASSSYVVSFARRAATARGRVFDLFPGIPDSGSKRLVQAAGGFYLLAHASGRPGHSLVCRVRTSGTIDWVRRLRLDRGHQLSGILPAGSTPEELLLCGRRLEDGGDMTALLARTDLELDSCRTADEGVATAEVLEFSTREWPAGMDDIEMRAIDLGLRAEAFTARTIPICRPTTTIELGEQTSVQSPYLYLQAVGSDTTDHSSRGVHLRWELGRGLGERHLPKGHLSAPDGPYPATLELDRADDFVRVYRAEFDRMNPARVDVREPPEELLESGATRKWTYRHRYHDPVEELERTTTIAVCFDDVEQYDALRAVIDPSERPADFMALYKGVLEIGAPGKPAFQADLHGFEPRSASAWLRLETVALPDALEPDTRLVTCRRELAAADLPDHTILSENVETLRLELHEVAFGVVDLHTYVDTLTAYNSGGGAWTELGAFSLAIDDAEVFARLEDPGRYPVDGRWPRFNEPDAATGAFTVRVANYRDKWLPAGEPQDGIKEAVVQYLERSRTDEKAPAALPSDQKGDAAHLDISYLDMLRLIAVDFHVARMLGLGHVDGQGPELADRRFLYLAEYVTDAALEPGGPGGRTQHLAMSLPTGQRDHRLPAPPVLLPPGYGLKVDNATPSPTVLTLAGGYDRFADVRYVNLHKEPAEDGRPVGEFFADPEPFCLAEETPPVFFGVEYRAANESAYRRPEIANDPDYEDAAGLAEVAPLPETGDAQRPVFTHRETEPGVHRYALYAINWFSRVSPLSVEVATDKTEFPKRAAPVAPLNFTAHLVQKEEPLIFTTQREQALLSALAGDPTLVRVTFDWNQVHHQAYQFADRVELFFRELPPRTVRGAVRAVVQLPGGQVRVETTSYPIASLAPPRTVQPTILPQDGARFAGGLLTAGEKSYLIEDVLQTDPTGQDPVFIVAAVKETASLDPDNQNAFLTVEDFIGPRPGERFLALENLDEESRWDAKLAKTIAVSPFDPAYTETVRTSDGTPIKRVIGGVSAKARITSLKDVDGDGKPMPRSRSGYYRVRFDAYQLPAPADPDVEWYQGTLRVAEDPVFLPSPSEPKRKKPLIKSLQVLKIDRRGSRLRLTVYDATFESGPGYVPILTGDGVDVNFHPSYRAYLRAESGNSFNATALLPSPGEGSRQTFLGARAVDTGAGCFSAITARAVLMAQELVEPEPPGEPAGPLYATRPDFYGKSTYTLDVGVNVAGRTPYALVFYRADERRILETLYKPTTIYDPETGILARLAALESPDADFVRERWHDLANVDYDSTARRFKAYVGGGFRFPIPDNGDYQIPNPIAEIDDRPFDGVRTFGDTFTVTLALEPQPITEGRSFERIVADAIDGAFLPLTEQPVIYKYLAAGASTSGRKPVVRDDFSRLLPPGHPDFDPFPMAMRRDGGSVVRFTDYTLDGASRRLLFYFAVELSNRLRPSDRSRIVGPVRLVNTAPPEEPGIKKVTTRLANPLREIGAAVRFEVNEYIASEEVTKIEIYRTPESATALSVRSMELVHAVNIGEEIVDEFADLPLPPFGDPLFYRLVAVREIVNEKGTTELVRSKPSRTVLASVVDNVNPPAPAMTWKSRRIVPGPPVELRRVVLSWPRTCYKGIYYLYRMTSSGNWSLIYQVRSNDEVIQYPPADGGGPDFKEFSETARLLKEDEDGRPLYHRFKVDVENASGLLNLAEKAVTI